MDVYNIENYIKRGKTVILTLRQGFEDGVAVRQWTDSETLQLIALMKEFLNEFHIQKRRKKEIWVDVAKKMQITDFEWTAEDCRKKWSNMIRTFKTIEEQRRVAPGTNKKIKWQFHEQMLELLSMENADSLPEAATVSAYMKDFPLDDTPQPIFQSCDGAHVREIVIPSLPGVRINTADPEDHQAMEQAVDTEQMQFYLVDNHDGEIRTTGPEATVTFTASTDDFQTLATVAASATSITEASTVHSGSLNLTSCLKPSIGKDVKFTDQIISMPPTSVASLLAIPASVDSNSSVETLQQVVSIPITSYGGQLQTLETRSSGAAENESATNSTVSIPVVPRVQGIPSTVSSYAQNVPRMTINRKKNLTKERRRKRPCEDETTGDPLVDKFIAISNKQNERVLERMEKFQKETLQVMRERNKLLENMLEFLKSQVNDSVNSLVTQITSQQTLMSKHLTVAGHSLHKQAVDDLTTDTT